MRALIQRVAQAQVSINNEVRGAIGPGLLVFLGVGHGDTEAQAEKLFSKISRMRIFADDQGKTNLSLLDVGGSLLIVSQFTLFADCKKGNRPSFTQAGDPAEAERLYRYFVGLADAFLEQNGAGAEDEALAGSGNQTARSRVATGEFGADMQVSLVNDGPFTIWLDTDAL